MNADSIRAGVDARLNEARLLLIGVRASERPLTPLQPTEAALRGLFYVACYAALEYAVDKGAQAFINFVCATNVQHRHLELPVHAIALDGALTSMSAAGERRKWAARRAVFQRMSEASACSVPDTAFGTFLHNVWPETIDNVFQCFAIAKSPTPDVRYLGYLKELVEKRNAVAHGRQTATEVGEGKTCADLQKMMDVVYETTTYYLSALEESATARHFVQADYRSFYP